MFLHPPAHKPIIFIQPPSTGSSSFQKWIRETLPAEWYSIDRFPRHATAIEAKAHFTDQEWTEAHVTALVRHPRARCITRCLNVYRGRKTTRRRNHALLKSTIDRPTDDNRPYWPLTFFTHSPLGALEVDSVINLPALPWNCHKIAHWLDVETTPFPHVNKHGNKPPWFSLPIHFRVIAQRAYLCDAELLGFDWQNEASPPTIQEARGVVPPWRAAALRSRARDPRS